MSSTTSRPAEVIGVAPVADAASEERAVMREAWRTLSVVGLASVFSGMSTSALNVALPAVVRHFSAGATAASWILLAFMLTQTVLMIAFGRLADLFGRRSMYLAGLATFTTASLLAGLAPSAWALVGFRVLQAAGSAMLLTNSAAIVTDAFPRHRLGQGMGIYLASFSIAQLLGPTLGGFLAAHAGWRWLFWYNVPVGAGCLIWGAVALRRMPRAAERRSLDVPGNLLVFLALGGGLVALSQVTALGWTDPLVLAGLALFAVLLPAFLLLERRMPHPLVDVSLFGDRAFAFGLLASFLNSVAQIGIVLLFALYFQAVEGEDPLAAGLHVLPVAVTALVFSSSSGFLQRRIGARTLTVVGNLTTAAGLAVLLLSVSAQPHYSRIVLGLVLAGAGSGLFMPSNTTALLRGIPSARLGIANAMRLMLQNTGIVVGTAVILSVLTSPLPLALRRYVFAGTISDVSGPGLRDLITGYHWTLLTMLGVCAGTLAASVCARRVDRRADEKAPVATVPS
jgi:EmrB/QacA subfamily drug resistance transporter